MTTGNGRILGAIERIGNRLPDPTMLFVGLLFITWLLSWGLSYIDFGLTDPRSGEPLRIVNQLAPTSLTAFFSSMVATFAHFHPIGVVLVAMLGIGVAEHTGFINSALRAMMSVTGKALLTPMIILVGIVSHTAADAGYVLVIPLGGVIFYAAGRHPLAGIAAAFAGVSGGFSANFVPSAIDPMLQGISQSAAQILDPEVSLNPLNNFFFTATSSLVIIGLGWFITDRIVEPRLAGQALDGDLEGLPSMDPLTDSERSGLRSALWSMGLCIAVLIATAWPEGSAWRGAGGSLTERGAPLMGSIVPLIFIFFLIPALVYGVRAGTVSSSRDVIEGMTKAMNSMAYYLVIMFFIAQFLYSFAQSNIGILLALEGAALLKALALPAGLTITGVVLLTGLLNLFIGSASAKWALLAPILVPMLMELGISPDLAQAAYRVGDSTTNIITPLMPYFPLVVVYCQRYLKGAGIGTVTALMLPYSITFIILWTAFLLAYWALGLPLGLQSSYTY
ncbi:aminobenzoyl-glutamate transporter [Halioglobus japonicus]|uniref:Aminobenzoyl-glutamate transporter n=1 Tax=Halioglobus japonicus TaxID=930805 RepID=A0AAP8MCF4_9GAMM|nr:AbgT family transporter [Halioglobus japonicus]AQA17164.1 aminobenzoyl-glutamate transporter [Halioglobus japonicus]PLW85074.1 aminobenzoyl-glutamate transporter [Halioglobus japonicus]GHD19341.1 aminobenzoyl-glutamate transporter [Halioglobus japonicus]